MEYGSKKGTYKTLRLTYSLFVTLHEVTVDVKRSRANNPFNIEFKMHY